MSYLSALSLPSLILFFFLRKPITKSFDIGAYTTELINDLLPKDYNKSLRPHYGEKPLQVNVSLLITDISGISETTMVR